MIPITDWIAIGGESDCRIPLVGEVVIHACKYPCHKKALGYDKIDESHPHYLALERESELFLNMIDPPTPLFRLETFTICLDFMRKHYAKRHKILIHCNRGCSRAPSIALLFMAKQGIISNSSYDSAYDEFEKILPRYQPGKGIETFLRQHWRELDPPKIEEQPDPAYTEKQIRETITVEKADDLVTTLPVVHFQGFTNIEDKSHAWIAPRANVLQRRMDEAYVVTINIMGVQCRLLVLKPRQVGCSTFAGHICYHHCRRFHSDMLMMADVNKRTEKIWDIFNSYHLHDAFPWNSRYAHNTESGRFTYPDGSIGEVEKDTAMDPKSGIAGTRQVIWYSEAARYAKEGKSEDKKVISASMASLAKVPTSLAIAETTAEGAAGWFYENWQGAATLEEFMEGNTGNGWIKVFAAWFEFEIKQLAGADIILDSETIEEIKSSLDEREKRLIALYANDGPQGKRLGTVVVTDTLWEQLAWRRRTLTSEYSNDDQLFDQDYPEDPESCFLSSGRPRFNNEGLVRLERLAKNDTSAVRGTLEQTERFISFLPNQGESWLWVREKPIAGCNYLAFLDPMTGEQSAGSKNPDTHAFGIIRKMQTREGTQIPHELVCAIDVPNGCRWDTDILAERISRVLKWYGDCMIVPEVNVALDVVTELRTRGCLIYHREKMDDINPGKRLKVVGWKTTPGVGGTRTLVVSAIATHIREQTFDCRYVPAVKQMRTFVVDARGMAAAKTGCHDDWVMGIGIGLENMDCASVYAPNKHLVAPPTPTKGAVS